MSMEIVTIRKQMKVDERAYRVVIDHIKYLITLNEKKVIKASELAEYYDVKLSFIYQIFKMIKARGDLRGINFVNC